MSRGGKMEKKMHLDGKDNKSSDGVKNRRRLKVWI